jgi:glycosyltransferase involved in cell wall biosynthesis
MLKTLKSSENLYASVSPGRVAIVHEWLVTFAGSERVVSEILKIFPDADLFAVVDFLSDEDRGKFMGKRAKTTFIQRLPFARTKFRSYLPLMPLAIEQLDLSDYDLVISSNHAVAKGVLTGPDQTHVCYCHTPIRYAWDLQHQYLRESGLVGGLRGMFARIVLHYIRLWDTRTASGVDTYVANSSYVARRIRKVVGRDAEIVHPPVDVEKFPLHPQKEDFYFTASRMVPYKRIDVIVEAFAALPERRLIVIGDGPEMAKIRGLAGPNVTLLGYQDDAILRDHMQRARAFIFAAEEDFGILPVEAQACGTPVIAFGRGGLLDTIIGLDNRTGEPATGVFFEKQTAAAVAAAIERFEAVRIEPALCRARAEEFRQAVFQEAFCNVVLRAVNRRN